MVRIGARQIETVWKVELQGILLSTNAIAPEKSD